MTYATRGGSARGADLGRDSDDPATWTGKITLRRVPINSGGYDQSGAYWGIGNPLYWASSDTSGAGYYFRARDRQAAKTEFRKLLPDAKFYR